MTRLLFALILLLSASVVQAAPTYRSSSSHVECGSCSSLSTLSYTVTAGDDLFVAIQVAHDSTPSISSVTSDLDGGLTQIGTNSPPGVSGRIAALYRKAAATAGTHTITITTSASINLITGDAFGYSSVGGLGTPAVANDTGNSPTISVNNASGDTMIMIIIGTQVDTNRGPGATGTEQFEHVGANGVTYLWDSTTAGTPTTITGDASMTPWAAVAVSLTASGGGGPTCTGGLLLRGAGGC